MSTLATILNRYDGNMDIMLGADGKPLSVSWADETLATQVVRLIERVTVLETQNERQLDLIKATNQKLDAMGAMVSHLDKKVSDLTTKIDSLKHSKHCINHDQGIQNQRLDNHWGQIETLTDLILDLQKRCPSKMGATVQENQDQIDGLEKSFQQMTGQLMSLQSVVRHLSQILDNNMKYSIQVAERDMGHLTNLKMLINNLQGSLNKKDQGVQDQIDELAGQIQGILASLHDIRTMIQVESGRISDLVQHTGMIPF